MKQSRVWHQFMMTQKIMSKMKGTSKKKKEKREMNLKIQMWTVMETPLKKVNWRVSMKRLSSERESHKGRERHFQRRWKNMRKKMPSRSALRGLVESKQWTQKLNKGSLLKKDFFASGLKNRNLMLMFKGNRHHSYPQNPLKNSLICFNEYFSVQKRKICIKRILTKK